MSSKLAVQHLNSDEFMARLAQAVPSMIGHQRIASVALTALQGNPRLMNSANQNLPAFFGALLQSAQLGLEVNTPKGEAYLIPYGGVIQFQLGYKGVVELLWRSGRIKTIRAEILYEGDAFLDRLDGAPEYLPCPYSKRGEPVGAFALIVTKDGGCLVKHMWKEEIEAIRDRYSKGFKAKPKDNPWTTAWDTMWMKTCLLRCAKLAPLSAELRDAVAVDEQTMHGMAPALAEVPSRMLQDAAAQRLEDMTNDTGDGADEPPAATQETEDDSRPPTNKDLVLAHEKAMGIPPALGESVRKAMMGPMNAASWKDLWQDKENLETFMSACKLQMTQEENQESDATQGVVPEESTGIPEELF